MAPSSPNEWLSPEPFRHQSAMGPGGGGRLPLLGPDSGAGRMGIARSRFPAQWHSRAHDPGIPRDLPAAKSPDVIRFPIRHSSLTLRNLRAELQPLRSFPGCVFVCRPCWFAVDRHQPDPLATEALPCSPPGAAWVHRGWNWGDLEISFLRAVWTSVVCPLNGDSHSGERRLKWGWGRCKRDRRANPCCHYQVS